MYDINSSNDQKDYAEFLHQNPILVDTIRAFADNSSTISPNTWIEGLSDIAKFLSNLKTEYENSKTHFFVTFKTYDEIKEIHSVLVQILATMEKMFCKVKIFFRKAKLTDIYTQNHIKLVRLNFDNLIIQEWDTNESNESEYPIIGVDQCTIKNVELNYITRQFIAGWSSIGSFTLNDNLIIGTFLNMVNVNEKPLTLPDCKESSFLAVIDSNVDFNNFKQMLSQNDNVKVFEPNSFLKEYQRLKPGYTAGTIEGIHMFNADMTSITDTTRFDQIRDRLNCDAFIVTNDPKVTIMKYEKTLQRYNELPRDMMELFVNLLSK